MEAFENVVTMNFEATEGVKFTSAPVTLTREGVMNGFYKPPEAINALADQPLVSIPVLFDHPASAQPEVTNVEEVIGIVTNLHVAPSEVDGEPSLQGIMHIMNIEETAEHRKKMMNGEPLEVSIGYYRDVKEGIGIWHEQAYDGIETIVIPYHLGLMKEARAACPVDMGCGVGVSEAVGHSIEGEKHASDNMADDAPSVSDLSLEAIVAENKCVAELQKTMEKLEADNKDIAEKVAELVTELDEAKEAVDELAAIKAEAQKARLTALAERLPENTLTMEDLEASSNDELERFEKLYPEPAEDELDEDGNIISVRVVGDEHNAGDDPEPTTIMPDSSRYFGQPQGTVLKED